MTFDGKFLEKNTEITFLFLEVQNSPDTRLSDKYREVEMIDPTRYLLTQYKGTTTLQTLYFATIQDKYLEQTTYGLKLSANYIIKYITINRIEKESTFLITYPNTTKALLNLTLDTCRIDYEGLTFNLNRCRINNMTREIFIQGGLDIEIAANKNVTITFGPIETPIT